MPHKDLALRKAYHKEYNAQRQEISKEYQKKYREENKDALRAYKQAWYKEKRFDKYGITKAEFMMALEQQHELCAICSTPFTEINRVYIDHCHKIGRVRGLICFHCNTGLGHFRDNILLLQKAINYLNDNPFMYTGLPNSSGG